MDPESREAAQVFGVVTG